MKVAEIFNSIEGEGKRAGLPCTFIRLYGCNLNCTYCDSKYATQLEGYTVMSIEEILHIVKDLGTPNITVTGGEPLAHDGIDNLLKALTDAKFYVNVETNGSIIPNIKSHPRLFYTMDYKTNASGMSSLMDMKAIHSLSGTDVLKFVVGSMSDMDQSLSIIEQLSDSKNKGIPQVYFSPVWGQIEPKEIVSYLLNHRLWDCKVQLQMHKLIWDPDMRGV